MYDVFLLMCSPAGEGVAVGDSGAGSPTVYGGGWQVGA